MTTPVSNTSHTSAASSASSTAAASAALGSTPTAAQQSANFLQMLVAQMQNQDPLNPMDSAQVTSQMAQISTVQGLQQLNSSIGTLGTQFTSMQTLQGTAMIGKDVATQGNAVRVNKTTGVGDGGFVLSNPATSVEVDVVNSAGQTIDKLQLGQLAAGRHSFDLNVPQADQGQALTFNVTAMNKSTSVDSMSLQYNTVNAVSSFNGSLAFELDNGQQVASDAIWSFL